jgi:hypothetical protein
MRLSQILLPIVITTISIQGFGFQQALSNSYSTMDCSNGYQQPPQGVQNVLFQNVSGWSDVAKNDNVLSYVHFTAQWFKDSQNKLIIWNIDNTLLTGHIARPVYLNIIETFKQLEQENWHVLAFTSKAFSPEMALTTYKNLEAIGLSRWFLPLNAEGLPANLERAQASDFNGRMLDNGVAVSGNILFVDPSCNKGHVLKNYLTVTELRLDAVIVVDSYFTHCSEISLFCNNIGLLSVAIHANDCKMPLSNSSPTCSNLEQVFTSSSDGEDILLQINNYLMKVDTTAAKLWFFLDLDDTVFYGLAPNGRPQLLYPQMPQIAHCLEEIGFAIKIATDRSKEQWISTQESLAHQDLGQILGDSPWLPQGEQFRNGLITPSIIFSSCKLTRQDFSETVVNHFIELQRSGRFIAARNFIQAHCATKANAIEHCLTPLRQDSSIVVIYLEDSEHDAKETYELLKALDINCLVIHSTKAEENRQQQIMKNLSKAPSPSESNCEDDDLL